MLFPQTIKLSGVDTVIIVLFCSDTERSQIAFVTFKDSQGAETAVLLSVIFLIFFL